MISRQVGFSNRCVDVFMDDHMDGMDGQMNGRMDEVIGDGWVD
jgi:hypothetical protein